MKIAGSPRRSAALLTAIFLECSCVTTEATRVPPAVNFSGGEPASGRPAQAGERASLGLEVETNESDALDRLEVLPGTRVRSVAPGGPASAAGIAPGDVVLAIDGLPTNGKDAFQAVAAAARPGAALRVEVRRGTAAFEASVVPAAALAGSPPVDLYQVDPVKLRAGFRTVVLQAGEGRRAAAEIAKLFPESPLERAGLRTGERVVALDGKEISSAEDLVRRVVEERDPGQGVTLTVRRGEEEVPVRLRLWAPPRRVARFLVPILFHYESKLRPRLTRWSVVDLWLISLFEYRREEGEREIRLFKFFRFRTGYGELVEEREAAPEEK